MAVKRVDVGCLAVSHCSLWVTTDGQEASMIRISTAEMGRQDSLPCLPCSMGPKFSRLQSHKLGKLLCF